MMDKSKKEFMLMVFGVLFFIFILYLMKSYFGTEIKITEPEIVKKIWEKQIKKQNLSKLNDINIDLGLVIDHSGSMSNLYQNGTVQSTLEKILAISQNLNYEEKFNVWLYANSYEHLSNINQDNVSNYVNNEIEGHNVGGGNNEIIVMNNIISNYANANKEIVILLITDGGVGSANEIIKLLKEKENSAIFWQFILVGNDNEYLKNNINDIKNAHLFVLENLSIPNRELYKQIFSNFPIWLNNRR